MKILSVVLLFFCMFSVSVQSSWSQKKQKNKHYPLVFEKDTIELGRIYEHKDTLFVDYPFVNRSNKSIKIVAVESDCACAIVKYPKEYIAPGGEGIIRGGFSPYKPGGFQKTFRVITNVIKDTTDLQLHGVIDPFALHPEIAYSVGDGALRMPSKIIKMGIMHDTTVVKKEVSFYNSSDTEIFLSDSLLSPNHIMMIIPKKTIINPGERLHLFMYYDPTLKDDYGIIHDHIQLTYTHDEKTFPVEIPIDAFIEHHIKEKDIKKDSIPRLQVIKTKLSLGKVSSEKVPEAIVTLRNNGNSDLKILKIMPDVGCKLITPSSYVIKKGESMEIKVLVGYINKKGFNKRRLYIFTNDPKKSTVSTFISVNFY